MYRSGNRRFPVKVEKLSENAPSQDLLKPLPGFRQPKAEPLR
jgi:hypothetical protein